MPDILHLILRITDKFQEFFINEITILDDGYQNQQRRQKKSTNQRDKNDDQGKNFRFSIKNACCVLLNSFLISFCL